MNRLSSPRSLTAFAAVAIAAAAGCGGGGGTNAKLVPVTGAITVDGQPLTVGTVTFQPDESKGNTGKIAPSAQVDASGNYKLTADNRDGAPVGWYKVSVTPTGMTMGGMPSGPEGGVSDPTKSLGKAKASINQKFQSPATSGISIEVTASPAAGAYDIKVTR